MSSFRNKSIAALTAGVALLPTAFAQTSPIITITFDAIGSVPVGTWGVALAAFAIAAFTAWRLRTQHRGASRALSLLVLAASVALALAGMAPNVDAVVPSTNLVTSPTTVNVTDPGSYMFVNATSKPISLRTVTFTRSGSTLQLDTNATTCTAGLAMQPSASCVVAIIGNLG